jgi:hypothetical protein
MKHRQKKASRRRIIVAAIALSLIYVLSSGPTQMLAFTWDHARYEDDGDGNFELSVDVHQGPWWPTVYAPLQWMSEQSWGEWIWSYWQLFRISRAPDSDTQ